MVEVYSRIANTKLWHYQTFENIDEKINFDILGFDIPIATIYESVVFSKI